MKNFFNWIAVLIIGGCCFACSTNEKQNNPTTDTNNADVEVLTNIVRQHPDSAILYEQLIDTLSKKQLFTIAAQWCDSAILHLLQPLPTWFSVKGDLYRKAGLQDSAISAYQSFLFVYPDHEQTLLNLAATMAEKGDSNSVPFAKEIALRMPSKANSSYTAYICGIYFAQTKQYAKAQRYFDTAIQFNYTFIEAWMEKGYSLYDQGKFVDAAKVYNQLTTIANSYADAWYWWAKSEEAAGNKAAAIPLYKRALLLDQQFKEAAAAIDRLQ